MMQEVAKVGEPVAGLGDEAFRRDRDLFFRISNLIVVILVMPNPASSEAQVTDLATALAADLNAADR